MSDTTGSENINDFRKGLILGMMIQPLEIVMEQTKPDASEGFVNHNILSDGLMINSVDNIITVDTVGETVICSAVKNPSTDWYCISNPIPLKTNHIYQLTAHQTFRGYGKIGITTTSSQNPDYNAGNNCACIKPAYDTRLLYGDKNHQTSYFIASAKPDTNNTSPRNYWLWFYTGLSYNDQRLPHIFNIALYEQVEQKGL